MSRTVRFGILAVVLAVAAAALPASASAQWRGGGPGWGGRGWGGPGWGGPGWGRGGWRGGCCWGGGVFVGIAPPPIIVGPPIVVAPPVLVQPPVIVSPSTSSSAPPPFGGACFAGPWVCPLRQPTPVGNSCSCPGSGGQSWGRAG